MQRVHHSGHFQGGFEARVLLDYCDAVLRHATDSQATVDWLKLRDEQCRARVVELARQIGAGRSFSVGVTPDDEERSPRRQRSTSTGPFANAGMTSGAARRTVRTSTAAMFCWRLDAHATVHNIPGSLAPTARGKASLRQSWLRVGPDDSR